MKSPSVVSKEITCQESYQGGAHITGGISSIIICPKVISEIPQSHNQKRPGLPLPKGPSNFNPANSWAPGLQQISKPENTSSSTKAAQMQQSKHQVTYKSLMEELFCLTGLLQGAGEAAAKKLTWESHRCPICQEKPTGAEKN
ncbi:uncharacterized protein [Taeniopygia guttata]|uniref:uncharacterized protein isoform X2 n=1 Tax=Taeniopygia guttata TaxID=59729 RepID=UPI003BB8D4A9